MTIKRRPVLLLEAFDVSQILVALALADEIVL